MLDDMSHVMVGDMSRSVVTIYAPGVMPNWWAAPVISFVVRCPTVLVDSGERLWSAPVIAVSCGTACACVVVAEGLAGPWTPPPLGLSCVSFYMVSGLLAGLLFNIRILTHSWSWGSEGGRR